MAFEKPKDNLLYDLYTKGVGALQGLTGADTGDEEEAKEKKKRGRGSREPMRRLDEWRTNKGTRIDDPEYRSGRDSVVSGDPGAYMGPMPEPSAATTRGIRDLQTPREEAWPRRPEAAPSREAVQSVADQTLADQADKTRERTAESVAAHSTANVYNEGADPPGQGSNQPKSAPTDPPAPKGGTGPGADSTRPPGQKRAEEGDPGYYDKVKMVKTKDGQIVSVDMPAGQRVTKAGGEWMDYSTAVKELGGRDSDVVSGSAGTVYTDAEGAEAAAAAIPRQRDTSPGWATRAALNEAFRRGELSMDPRAVMERRAWEKAEEARDMERDLVRAQADAAIATEEYKLREAQLDPLERARIAAEAKWGPQLLKEQGLSERIVSAVSIYQGIMEKIKEARDTMEPGPQLDAYIEMLERFARDQANIIMGHAVRDPRSDPMAAFLSTLATPRTPTTET
jgi:hypothetical protein